MDRCRRLSLRLGLRFEPGYYDDEYHYSQDGDDYDLDPRRGLYTRDPRAHNFPSDTLRGRTTIPQALRGVVPSPERHVDQLNVRRSQTMMADSVRGGEQDHISRVQNDSFNRTPRDPVRDFRRQFRDDRDSPRQGQPLPPHQPTTRRNENSPPPQQAVPPDQGDASGITPLPHSQPRETHVVHPTQDHNVFANGPAPSSFDNATGPALAHTHAAEPKSDPAPQAPAPQNGPPRTRAAYQSDSHELNTTRREDRPRSRPTSATDPQRNASPRLPQIPPPRRSQASVASLHQYADNVTQSDDILSPEVQRRVLQSRGPRQVRRMPWENYLERGIQREVADRHRQAQIQRMRLETRHRRESELTDLEAFRLAHMFDALAEGDLETATAFRRSLRDGRVRQPFHNPRF